MRFTRRKVGLTLLAAMASSTIALTSIGAAGASTRSPASSSAGKVATWAEAPSAVPNYIFPFQSLAYFSVTNINQFQVLMYRPLYWFGTGSKPTLNTSLSLAYSPTYSDGNKTVTVKLKNYKWSNGESVTSTDVLFWMNMMRTEKANWAGYSPGTLPDDVTSIDTPNASTIVFHLNSSVNSYWFTYNELSQITPMPLAWDVTSATAKAGSGGCSSAVFTSITLDAKGNPSSTSATACAAVYDFLSEQSGYNPTTGKAASNTPNYASNPIWAIVDGPWKLKSYTTTGYVDFVPNPDYSGPVKPKLAGFDELPYTSDTSEFNALVGGKLDYGYVPSNDLSSDAPSPTVAGKNNSLVSSNYNLVPVYSWGIAYFPYNFKSTGDGGQAGKIFSQLYFRQAFQELVDQSLYVKAVFKGYAVPTYGPVPVLPKNPFASAYEKKNPYPYSVKNAVALLKAHGWDVKPGGTTVCATASKCGVPKGTPLSFTLQYATGLATTTQMLDAEKASWAEAGIQIKLTSSTFDTVIGNAVPCPKGCSWELEDWVGGWVYAPDFYPTGEDLFETGAGSNSGSYSNAKNDTLIKETDLSSNSKDFTTWENYLTKASPVVWQPNQAYALYEISKKLHGATPVNPLLNINPEDWTLSS